MYQAVAESKANQQDSQLPLNRSEEHTSELQSRLHLVCRLLLEKKKKLRSSVILLRSSRPSFSTVSRLRADCAESVLRVVPPATCSSLASVTKRIVRPVVLLMRR